MKPWKIGGLISGVESFMEEWHDRRMATLILHNIPDALHDTLKRLARMHHRSVDEEAMAVFEQALPKPPNRAEVVADIIARTHAARAKMKRFMTDEEIEAAKEEGRA